jgi:hypothetical protein
MVLKRYLTNLSITKSMLIIMMKRYVFFVSEEQSKLIKKRASVLGFSKKVDYIRFMLFIDSSIVEKIEDIHKEVCKK